MEVNWICLNCGEIHDLFNFKDCVCYRCGWKRPDKLTKEGESEG